MKIFGREPALWLSLLFTTIAMISAFVINVTAAQQGAINAMGAMLIGLILAAMVHDGVQAAVLGFIKAALALALAFGLHMTTANQAIVMAFVSTVTAMFLRTQVTAPVTATDLHN